MMNKGMYSSKSPEYETPQDLFDLLHKEFRFTLDPCATPDNAKCDQYFTVEDDGLSIPWSGSVFMNPPYGDVIIYWMKKAYEESLRDEVWTVVCLVPCRTDTVWWHDYVMMAHDIRLIKRRLKFGGLKNSAPFPSAVVVFTGQDDGLCVTTLDFKGGK